MPFDLDPNYKDVPQRIADFKAKHPEGTFQPADRVHPYRIETIGDRGACLGCTGTGSIRKNNRDLPCSDCRGSGIFLKTFIVYTAAAYRTPTDTTPGIGTAWEPFPGLTPYTRDSELQNAETSAWGRAIVAALASESKSVASAEDVRNRRQAEPEQEQEELASPEDLEKIKTALNSVEDLIARAQVKQAFVAQFGLPDYLVASQVAQALEWALLKVAEAPPQPTSEPESDSTPSADTSAPENPSEVRRAPSMDQLTKMGATPADIAEAESIVKEMTAREVDEALKIREMSEGGTPKEWRQRLTAQLTAEITRTRQELHEAASPAMQAETDQTPDVYNPEGKAESDMTAEELALWEERPF